MIKKLWIMLIIGLSVFMLPMLQVNAQEDEPIYDENLGQIAFNFTNLFSTYYALTAINRIELNTEYIEITIPQSSYHVPEAGGVDSEFIVYFNDGTYETINMLGVFGGNVYGNGVINLKSLYNNKWFLAYEIETVLVQNITAAPSGYVQAMSDGSVFNYYVNTGNFVPTSTWSAYVNNDTYPYVFYMLKGEFKNVWRDVISITIYIPPSEYLYTQGEAPSVDPTITFIYSSGSTSINLRDVGSFGTGLFFINFLDYDIPTDELKNFIIEIPTSFTVIPPNFIVYMAENSYMLFDEYVYEIRYYDINGDWVQTYDTDYLLDPPAGVYPLPDVGILKFKYYVYPDGKEVDLSRQIDPTYIINNRLNLYGFYRAEIGTATEVPDPIPDVNTFTNVLDAFGWNNNVGYIAILIIITALITVPLILLGVPLLVISIVNIAITSFFTYMGLLPMIAIIILYLLWFSMIVVSFRRSDVYE